MENDRRRRALKTPSGPPMWRNPNLGPVAMRTEVEMQRLDQASHEQLEKERRERRYRRRLLMNDLYGDPQVRRELDHIMALSILGTVITLLWVVMGWLLGIPWLPPFPWPSYGLVFNSFSLGQWIIGFASNGAQRRLVFKILIALEVAILLLDLYGLVAIITTLVYGALDLLPPAVSASFGLISFLCGVGIAGQLVLFDLVIVYRLNAVLVKQHRLALRNVARAALAGASSSSSS